MSVAFGVSHMTVIKYYKTKLEGRNEDRFQMLAKMLEEDSLEMENRIPKILHIQDIVDYQSVYKQVSAIVAWIER